MDVFKMFDELIEVVEAGVSVPLFGKSMVDREELLEIIEEIKARLPEDLIQAKWINDEKQRILAEAQKQATAIVQDAETKFIMMVDEHELTKKANEQAAEIVNNAQAYAREVRLGAISYADKMLEDCEGRLLQLAEAIHKNRESLNKN